MGRAVLRALLVLLLLVLLGATALYLSTPDVAYLARENPTTTAYMQYRQRQAAEAARAFELRHTWVPLEAIAPSLCHLVVYAEDKRFWRHGGVDWKALRQAVTRAIQAGRIVRGASTITQQLARNLYLSPEPSLVRKLREAVVAWRLEAALGKDRILELYLNVVEWGDGVFGAEAAAQRWYGCAAADLSPAQAARLAVALPQPFDRSPAVASPDLTFQAACLLARICWDGLLTPAQRDRAFDELGVCDATRPPADILAVPVDRSAAGRRAGR